MKNNFIETDLSKIHFLKSYVISGRILEIYIYFKGCIKNINISFNFPLCKPPFNFRYHFKIDQCILLKINNNKQ